MRRYDNIQSDPCTIHFPSHQQRFVTVTVTAALRQDKGISSAMVEMTHDDDTRSQARVTVQAIGYREQHCTVGKIRAIMSVASVETRQHGSARLR